MPSLSKKFFVRFIIKPSILVCNIYKLFTPQKIGLNLSKVFTITVLVSDTHGNIRYTYKHTHDHLIPVKPTHNHLIPVNVKKFCLTPILTAKT